MTAGSSLKDVGVVVLSYGPNNSADGVVERLCRDGRVSVEDVLEVHNPSQPGEAATPHTGQRVLNLTENVGYAGGMNAGIAALKDAYPYVLLLTHDVRIDGVAVSALRAGLDEHPELAITGPLLTEDQVVWSAGKRRMPDWRFLHIDDAVPDGRVIAVDSLDGSVLCARSADLAAVPLDSRFFMYFEETDLIERLRAAGVGGAGVVSSVRAESIPGGAAERPFSHAYLIARNGLWVALRHGGCAAGARYASTELREAGRLVLRTPPSAAYNDSRSFALRRLLAKLTGLVDCLRRHFGPPPRHLRDGDLRV